MKKFLVVAVCVCGVAVAQAGEKQKEKAKNDKTPACCAEGKKEVAGDCSADSKACCSTETKVTKAKSDTRVALLSPKAAESRR